MKIDETCEDDAVLAYMVMFGQIGLCSQTNGQTTIQDSQDSRAMQQNKSESRQNRENICMKQLSIEYDMTSGLAHDIHAKRAALVVSPCRHGPDRESNPACPTHIA